MNFLKGKMKILIPIVSIALVIAIAAIVIFTRPNLKVKNIKSPTKIGILIQFGIPTNGLGSDDWTYRDCIKFHGIQVDSVSVDFNENEIAFIEFDDGDQDDLVDTIDHYCDFKENLLGMYYDYTYGDTKITIDSDGSYVNFEFY